MEFANRRRLGCPTFSSSPLERRRLSKLKIDGLYECADEVAVLVRSSRNLAGNTISMHVKHGEH